MADEAKGLKNAYCAGLSGALHHLLLKDMVLGFHWKHRTLLRKIVHLKIEIIQEYALKQPDLAASALLIFELKPKKKIIPQKNVKHIKTYQQKY